MGEQSWRSIRSTKSAATRKAREGPDVFRRMGAKGGKRPKKGAKSLVDLVPYEPLPTENNQEKV